MIDKKKTVFRRVLVCVSAVIVAFCFVLAAFLPSLSFVSASADVANPPTDVGDITEQFNSVKTYGGVTNYSTQQSLYFEVQSSVGGSAVDLVVKGIQSLSECSEFYLYYAGDLGNSNGFQIDLLSGNTSIAYNFLPNADELTYFNLLNGWRFRSGYSSSTDWNGFRIYLNRTTATTTWIQIFRMSLWQSVATSPALNYTSYLYNLLESQYNNGHTAGYDEGHTAGYNDGHTAGYNQGYTAGKDAGLAQTLNNPLSFFFNPVVSFLDTEIFGVISIGDVLALLLYTAVAIIFIKMFAGG